MSEALPPTDPAAHDAPPATAAALAEMAGRIAALERDRRRIRREDWQTLFRQLHTLAGQLAEHPFLKGDLEAEQRVAHMLSAPDLLEFDRRVDRLGEYVQARLAAAAAQAAAETGVPVPEPPRLRSLGPSDAGFSRRAAAQGLSGSDFDLGRDGPADPGGAAPPRRRGVIRL